MAQSSAATVEAYLEELPEERRAVVAALREIVLHHLPEGYRETMNWGMISYEVPLERYPNTYNGQPLVYAALAAQKNHFSLYLNGVYQDPDRAEQLKREAAEAGKKLDMGKSCLRFRKLEDLPLKGVARAVAGTPVEAFLARYETVHRQ